MWKTPARGVRWACAGATGRDRWRLVRTINVDGKNEMRWVRAGDGTERASSVNPLSSRLPPLSSVRGARRRPSPSPLGVRCTCHSRAEAPLPSRGRPPKRTVEPSFDAAAVSLCQPPLAPAGGPSGHPTTHRRP